MELAGTVPKFCRLFRSCSILVSGVIIVLVAGKPCCRRRKSMLVRVSNLVFVSCEMMGVLLSRHVGFSHRRRSWVAAAAEGGYRGYRQTGSEAVTFVLVLQQVVDEIQNYYDCHYISSCEAAWKIFGYNIQIKEPVVIRLPFHFLEEHVVIFRDDDNIQDVLNRVDGKLTKLLAWFLANTLYTFARLLTYSEFPNKFVWKDDKGCTSFVDLRTIHDVIYDTFKEACYTLGILQDDKKFVDAILEAKLPLSDEQILNLTLVKIKEKLQANGRSLREFSTLSYPDMQNIDGVYDRFLMDEMNFDRELLHEELKDSLKSTTHEQKNAYDQILNSISMDLGGFYFVYGYSGTGKTFLYRTLSVSLRCNSKIKLNVALSDIASLLLPNRHTAHSRFKIPLNINENSLCNFKQGFSLAKLLARANCESEVLIPNEILIDDTNTDFEELIQFVYPMLLYNMTNTDYFKKQSILAPTLEVVNKVNNSIMSLLPGDQRVYLCSDSLCVEEGLPNHQLCLKEGVPAIRNIDQSNGLCNGTKLQIPTLHRDSLTLNSYTFTLVDPIH
ncbi:uncharacterized protein LOC107640347 [Arachis ipaensis]|uniref:uncharacterized protein LOC107640347 n=1 Tax=Arachis ipaensis TaxID=130454 RepID=UPI000A2AFB55|nr:uncharacterized protein LOC107640347 [Arachis ipaensis]